jgi:uncharacterized membrane protein YbhN (UPF0104 family)
MNPRHPRLGLAARVAFYGFLLLVAALLVRYARGIDWHQVGAAVVGYDARALVMAVLLTAASYLLYCGYDLAARHYAHHALRTRRVVLIAFVSYALSMNIGALLGGAGFRLRLYSRAGLPLATITRIIAFSTATNWLGYLLVAGVLFAGRTLVPPASWRIGTDGLQALGVAMLLLVVAYLAACRVTHGRVYHLRGHHFRFPSLRLALLQLALAACDWMLMAGILFVLLQGAVAYPVVLAVLLVGAVGTALMHVPAGIGVLEAIFVALLGDLLPDTRIIAAVLVYRAVYYLLPLLVAMALYLALEARRHEPFVLPWGRRGRTATRQGRGNAPGSGFEGNDGKR